MDRLKETLADAQTQITGDTDIKEKARIVRAVIGNLADRLKVDLKLRK